ncbi:hypothetical protein PsorP6_015283 [Peronosclerospora sorghi]|uniref:Uncharacterized protein n=1 Tax=Peronosclerospora sorghi TaxID=230839 RepID=A0ACC0VV59_9STRA|nr:hypothetical protein PsorP6_015283 [Peronosclerospora sorghi]
MDIEGVNETRYNVVLDSARDAVSVVSATVAHEASMADADRSKHIRYENYDNGDNQVDENIREQCEDAFDGTDQVIVENHEDAIIIDAHPIDIQDDDESVSANYGSEVNSKGVLFGRCSDRVINDGEANMTLVTLWRRNNAKFDQHPEGVQRAVPPSTSTTQREEMKCPNSSKEANEVVTSSNPTIKAPSFFLKGYRPDSLVESLAE